MDWQAFQSAANSFARLIYPLYFIFPETYMNNKQLHLVCYDVSDDKRLYHALKITRDYALGGQKSVHECWLSPAEKQELCERLERILEPEEDSLMIIRLDPRQQALAMGRGSIPENTDWFYIG